MSLANFTNCETEAEQQYWRIMLYIKHYVKYLMHYENLDPQSNILYIFYNCLHCIILFLHISVMFYV